MTALVVIRNNFCGRVFGAYPEPGKYSLGLANTRALGGLVWAPKLTQFMLQAKEFASDSFINAGAQKLSILIPDTLCPIPQPSSMEPSTSSHL